MSAGGPGSVQCAPVGGSTHVGERGQGAQVADAHQAQDELLALLHQNMRVLVQHGRDHTLKAGELSGEGVGGNTVTTM